MDIKLFVATKASIAYQGEILLLRESAQYADETSAGRYDVVGGRVSPGERFNNALLREAHEETGLTVRIGRLFHVGEWRPVARGEPW